MIDTILRIAIDEQGTVLATPSVIEYLHFTNFCHVATRFPSCNLDLDVILDLVYLRETYGKESFLFGVT